MTWGKGRLEMGWVEIDVEMGEDAQSRYELLISTPPVEKLATTMTAQMILKAGDFEVAMWLRPCMEEFSRNSVRSSISPKSIVLIRLNFNQLSVTKYKGQVQAEQLKAVLLNLKRPLFAKSIGLCTKNTIK